MNELLAGKRLFIQMDNGDLFDVTDEIALVSSQQDQRISELEAAHKQVIGVIEAADDCGLPECYEKGMQDIDAIVCTVLAKD